MKKFWKENGHYEIGYPTAALSAEYHPLSWWLGEVRSGYEDGSLTDNSPEIKCLVALGIPLEKIRRGPRDASVEGNWYEDIWRKSKECIHASQSTSKQGLYENQYEESLLKGFDMQTDRI